jgi:uncharacterized protein (DUF58 family)
MGGILVFLLVLLTVAFFTRVDAFFYLFYAFFGIYVLGRLWARHSIRSVAIHRRHDNRIFLGQTLTVRIEVHNQSWLPVLWLSLNDRVPGELTSGAGFRQVVSLLPHERITLSYRLHGRRRGYYPIGPLVSLGGDLLGSVIYKGQHAEDDFVVVYPKIVTLHDLGFASQSPFGTLPSRERIFEDPTRIQGVRTYQPGDPLKRIDWKTSARVSSLQIRRYEPAIALETAIFVNLAGADYTLACRYQATELAIVVAASVAVHLAEKRQAVGLVTNGRDPLAETPNSTPSLPLRKGRDHLIHILDLLARIETTLDEDEATPFLDLLNRKTLGLSWGSTVVVMTAAEVKGLLDSLIMLRRRGMVVILVSTCPHRGFALTVQRAERVGIQALQIWSEKDLAVWR